jgi:beta-lactamase class A
MSRPGPEPDTTRLHGMASKGTEVPQAQSSAERAGDQPESLPAGPEPHAFGMRLQHAVDGLAVHGRLHVAAWEPDTADRPLLISADEAVSAASTIKVPILAAALDEVDAGRLDLGQLIAIPSQRTGGSGVLHALPSLRTLTLADLLTLMIIVSDNTATNVVIDLIGMERVNQFCADAGLKGTVLRRKMMDADAMRLGLENTTTAHDQAMLLDAIAWRNLLPAPLRAFALQALERQQFNDGLPSLLPDDVIVAHKTGELPGIRHDVGIITGTNGRQAVVAVLVSGIDAEPLDLHHGRSAATRSNASSPSAALAAIGFAAWRALSDAAAVPGPVC